MNIDLFAGQSADQRDLLAGLPETTPVYVEGAFRVWLDSSQVFFRQTDLNEIQLYAHVLYSCLIRSIL